ncbi:heme biosynthesis operon protein HemX [Pseudomonas sp. C27(2019)]|uniref:uroporphyrinogen-III C-methyltransferase n=1 Tax=Pseudomonas sp. C27(2019) TaxID=2604941 RepID=UPI001246DC96|nr:uroporphyrinogen-III C-methyltransferase [Pseudomonas sp. C27(2019)]QEY59687.1 heme biosynthesis operon protein HemX [Pseudomonas sp. C27(2019)]
MTQPPEKPDNKGKASPEASSKDTTAKPEVNASKAGPKTESKGTPAKHEANADKASPKTDSKDTTSKPPEASADKASSQTASKDASAAKQPEKNKTQPSKPVTTSSGKGIAILALLFGLGGLGAGAWSVWHIQNTESLTLQQQQQQQQKLASLQTQISDLSKGEQQLRSTIGQMPSDTQLQQSRDLLARVQAEQQLLSQRLETVLGASRQDWRLAEAEHLLRMASLRLNALHDTNSARFLLEAADHILLEQDDPAAFAAREQLAHTIAALKSSGNLDRTGLFVQLGALYQQANQLTDLAPEFVQHADAASADGAGRWAQWWQQISRYLRVDFNASEHVQPLLAGQSLTQVRLALSLSLEQAQWGALNGATEVYQQALQQAISVLDAHFSTKDPSVSGLRDQINALREQKVTQQMPNLNAALSTLQAYIATRSAPQAPNADEAN